MFIFCLYGYSLCIFFSNHFICFPTNNYELNLDSPLNITEVCLPIYSNPPCANMCECNHHAEQSSDEFVSPLPARYRNCLSCYHVIFACFVLVNDKTYLFHWK